MESRGIPISVVSRQRSWATERYFFSGMSILFFFVVFIGFADTFFLKHWFPESAVHAPPESYFMIHGTFFTAWLLFLIVQSLLIGTSRVTLHRKLGVWGAVLAGVMFCLGVYAGLLGAHRTTGFIDIPIPRLEFLTVPIIAIFLFATLVMLGIVKRSKPQSHKRFLLLATLSMIGAGIVRWPFDFVAQQSPLPFFSNSDLLQDFFLLPIIAWDVTTLGRIHPVTLWGALAIIASALFGILLSKTEIWLKLASWAVGLLG